MDSFTLYENATTIENHKFKITGSGVSVTGIMQNELSFAGSNEYSSAKDLMDSVLGSMGGIGDKISKVKQLADTGLRMGGRSTVTDYESRLVWNSSDKPQFTIEYKIYNQSSADSVDPKRGALFLAKNLQKGVLPTKGKPSPTRKGLFYKAPLGYKFAGKGGVRGTVMLEVGTWFKAGGLVIRNTNFTPSIQVMKSGQPLFVTGSVTLEPYQLISYDEFVKYFI